MLILGRRHLEAALTEYVEHYNSHRPHRSLDQREPSALDTPPALIGDIDLAQLRRTDRLGGLLQRVPDGRLRWADGVLGTHRTSRRPGSPTSRKHAASRRRRAKSSLLSLRVIRTCNVP